MSEEYGNHWTDGRNWAKRPSWGNESCVCVVLVSDRLRLTVRMWKWIWVVWQKLILCPSVCLCIVSAKQTAFVCACISCDCQQALICSSVCVYKSVYASLNMHYLPHYSWSPTTANGNSSPNSLRRCGCECMRTGLCLNVWLGNTQCISQ